MEGTAALQPATGLDDLQQNAIDRYIASSCWIAFFRPHLSGIVLWGHLDGPAIADLGLVIATRYGQAPEPHPVYFDVRAVESVTPSVFTVRSQLLSNITKKMVRHTTRVALVHGGGLIGATFVGIRAIAPAPVPEAFFDDPLDALRWIDREEDAELIGEVERLREEVLDPTTLLREMRVLLEREPRASLHDAAKSLGMSERSLQRRLAFEGTTFQRQQAQATVRVAQRLLLDSCASITQVAVDLGYASPQQLATLFRRHIGEAPTSWRKRLMSTRIPIRRRAR